MSDQRVFSQHASDLRIRQVPRIRLRGLARANLLLTSLGIIALLLAGCTSAGDSPSSRRVVHQRRVSPARRQHYRVSRPSWSHLYHGGARW